jgi:predicted DsbA family dithiol-disulfide isomerase
MKEKIRIDVVSDVVCPWCYIGKRRLERAVERLANEFEFEVQYHPFELNPNMPLSGLDQKTYLSEKFGSDDRYDELISRVSQVAESEGIIFDYESQKISPNTRKLHVLIQFAGTKGLQNEMVEILFNAYFTSGIDLSRDENILKAAIDAGLREEEVRQVLEDESKLVDIAIAEQEMHKLGITGVPFFIINNKYGISGAQVTDTFEKVLRDIGTQAVPEGEACDTEQKNC